MVCLYSQIYRSASWKQTNPSSWLLQELLDRPWPHVLLQCLKPKTGFALVAAKSFYFGVGGGTASFMRLVEQDGTFTVQSIATFDDGASNKREILQLKFADVQQQQ